MSRVCGVGIDTCLPLGRSQCMQMYLITVKVAGGMRIVQHKHEKGDNQSREEKKEQEEEYGTV